MTESDDASVRRVYEYALAHDVDSRSRPLTTADISQGTGIPGPEVDNAVAKLQSVGLLDRTPDRGLTAASPDEATASTVGPVEREIRAQRTYISETRRYISSFLPVFEASEASRERRSEFVLLERLAEVRGVIADLTARAQEEVLTAQPGGAREEEILQEAWSRDRNALARGVKMRVLYQHTARFNTGTTAYVEQLVEHGAQVRTLDDHFTRLLVFDDEAAVISVPDNPLAAAIVREPRVVAFIKETYNRLWLAGQPFSVDPESREEIVNDLRQAITRLLVEGLTDASIASRLGMSVRTCRRHIADMMSELGAQSRFQAGYLMASRTRQN